MTETNTTETNIKVDFKKFCWRIIAVHMISYFMAGGLAQFVFNYKELITSNTFSAIMRPYTSSLVALGPSLQAINGFFMALILYRIRNQIINEKKGWLTLFLLVAGFSVFTPQAPAPGSFEGFIYTKFSVVEHLIGLPECFLYAFIFSFGAYQWFRKPKKIWNILAITIVSLIVIVSILGYLASIQQP